MLYAPQTYHYITEQDDDIRLYTPQELTIHEKQVLGKGAFGVVCRGTWKRKDAQEKVPVAVKRLFIAK